LAALIIVIGALAGLGVAALVARRRFRRGRGGGRNERRERGRNNRGELTAPPGPGHGDGPGPAPDPEVSAGVAERVDLALRHAWAAWAEAGRGEPPSVLAVRVGELGVELLLDPPVPEAPGMFVASEDGGAWTLGAEVPDAELRRGAGHQPSPLPALVTAGITPEGPVLIDVMAAGVLSVEGDQAQVGGFLAGAALELATAPWAVGTRVGLLGGDERLRALANVQVLSVEDLVSLIGPDSPAAAPGLRASLGAGSGIGVVVVAPGVAAPEVLTQVAGAMASSAAGVVAPGPVAGARWRLVLGPGGDAFLHPLCLELRAGVDAGAVALTVGALCAETTGVPDGAAGTGRNQAQPAAGAPGVLVLGPVEVRWPERAGRRPTRRKLDEVVAYLACHGERPVPGERLRTAIWPVSDDERAGEVADSTFRGTMSRTRAALGSGADGRPYLPEARDGAYQLDAGLGCDWADFAALVRRARTAPAPQAAELLGEALGLVRGAPFADPPPGAYGWAWSEQLVSVMEVAIADAAERLAALALAAGDHATARWASHKGLQVVPGREALYRARMRAAFEAGDVDDVEQAYTEVRRAARVLGQAEEPQAETTALYQRLRRAARRGPVDAVGDAVATGDTAPLATVG
jgi:DNA-binding SARP family transcriptional activator